VKWFCDRHRREQEMARLRLRNQQLQARVAVLEADNARLLAELAAARKHSGNSSKPPSSDITTPARKRPTPDNCPRRLPPPG
jgi:hypothetical protein